MVPYTVLTPTVLAFSLVPTPVKAMSISLTFKALIS